MSRAHRSCRRILASITYLILPVLAGCADAPSEPSPTPTTAQRDLTIPRDLEPVPIAWDTWKSVSAGGDHSCGVMVSGKVYCWGSNAVGQLGSSGADALRPRAINLSNTPGGANLSFISVSVGEDHTCGVTGVNAGPIYCWGSNIGVTPTALPTGLTFNQVSVGTSEACAVTPVGYAYCWTLGGSPRSVYTAPLSLLFASISVGFDHTCAITKTTARTYCWGINDFGQLGVNSFRSRDQPTEVLSPVGNNQFSSIAWHNVDAGKRFTCGIQQPLWTPVGPLFAGAKCWGKSERGQVGNGLTIGSAHPEAVFDPPGAVLDLVSAGGQQACAIELTNNSHGEAWCWGDNTSGQLGDPTVASSVSFPTRVAGTRVYKQISAGRDHTCALSQYTRANNIAGATPGSAVIQCWGLNTHGQLGNLRTVNSSTAVTALHPQQIGIIFP